MPDPLPPEDDPCIICVAITGSGATRADNPAAPVTVAERIESTHQAFGAGAAIAHRRVRDDDGAATSDPGRLARLKEGLEAHRPGMVVQRSTGGRSGAGRARGGMLPRRPDMASLSLARTTSPPASARGRPTSWTGWQPKCPSTTRSPRSRLRPLPHPPRPPRAPGRPPEGAAPRPVRVGGEEREARGPGRVRRRPRHHGRTDARGAWCGAGIGRFHKTLNERLAAAGGRTRVGIEDNIRPPRNELAPSYAALVKIATDLCERYERPVADWRTARRILALPEPAAARPPPPDPRCLTPVAPPSPRFPGPAPPPRPSPDRLRRQPRAPRTARQEGPETAACPRARAGVPAPFPPVAPRPPRRHPRLRPARRGTRP